MGIINILTKRSVRKVRISNWKINLLYAINDTVGQWMAEFSADADLFLVPIRLPDDFKLQKRCGIDFNPKPPWSDGHSLMVD